MTKTLLLIIAGLFAASVCCAQSPDSITNKKVNKRTAELKNEKVDPIICYYVDCVGYVKRYYPDSCNTSLVKYLFWKIDTTAYIQHFDNCNDYEMRQVSSQLINTILKNPNTIKKAHLEYPQYVEIVNGKKHLLSVMRDHSCHYMFEIHTSTGVILKDIDDFALDTKYIDNKYPNLNYNKNQESILTTLKTISQQLISKLYPTKKAP
nr:hypothetical protein [Mucilaginibacter sp. L294]